MDLAADALHVRDVYALMTSLVVPRPIGWVSTQDASGCANLAPFSYFSALGSDPPMLTLGIADKRGTAKDTLRNIRDTGVFCVNLVEEPLLGSVAPAGFGAGGPLGAGHGLSWGSCSRVGRVRAIVVDKCGVSAICFHGLTPPPACPRREVTHGSRPARGDHRARHRPRPHGWRVARRLAPSSRRPAGGQQIHGVVEDFGQIGRVGEVLDDRVHDDGVEVPLR